MSHGDYFLTELVILTNYRTITMLSFRKKISEVLESIPASVFDDLPYFTCSVFYFSQARSQDRFFWGGGCGTPKEVDLLDAKSGLFEPPSYHPATKTSFLAHFVAKSGPFARLGGASHPATPPLATGLISVKLVSMEITHKSCFFCFQDTLSLCFILFIWFIWSKNMCKHTLTHIIAKKCNFA